MSAMSTKTVSDRVTDLLTPFAERQGLEVVATDVCGPQGKPIVRVYLDREGGVDLDAIVSANEWISQALEEYSPVEGAYVLEVSSPGIDRPLKRLKDFVQYSGSQAVLKTAAPVEGRRRFSGVVARVEGDTIVIDSEGTEYRVPHGDITKANLKVDIHFGDE
jgi:ribosome maturation factor RimP